MQIIRTTVMIGALIALIGTTTAKDNELKQQALTILKNSQNSIITVTTLSKMEMEGVKIQGGGSLPEISCTGVVIDMNGLTVVSYATLNPMEGHMMMMGGGDGDGDAPAGAGMKPKITTSRIQMCLPDGTVIPARIVFKDKELDIAFLLPAPKEGDKKPVFTPLKLDGGGTATALDDIVIVDRYTKEFGCQPSVSLAQINAVINKPRLMYGLESTSTGQAIFLPDGKLLGMSVCPASKSIMQQKPFILPASEIAKLAAQATESVSKKSDE